MNTWHLEFPARVARIQLDQNARYQAARFDRRYTKDLGAPIEKRRSRKLEINLARSEVWKVNPRFEFREVSPDLMPLMFAFEKYVHKSGLGPRMLELIKTRSSQINHCAHCLDMHTKDAIALGEDPQRLYCLTAWREAPFYSDAERAALALTEAVTLIADGGVPDDVYEEARKHFSERQFVDLVVAINTINCWNRLNVTAQSSVGDYQAGMYSK